MKKFTHILENNKLFRNLILAIFALALTIPSAQSQLLVDFTKVPDQIFSIKGDYTMLGNTSLIRVNYSDDGQNGNNDMGYVDIDGDADTWNSSTAAFDYSVQAGADPNCTKILYAGLYWTGRANNGGVAGNTVDATRTVNGVVQNRTFTKNQIKFKAAGDSYQTIDGGFIYNPPVDYYQIYSCYADVTEYVKAHGTGNYTAADMALVQGNADGVGYFGCWSLVVVYENSKMKDRDISIFQGHAFNSNSNIVDIPVTGFQAVQSGDVNVKIGFLAGEGDRELTGDYAKIKQLNTNNYISLVHSTNATNNFFNSSINTGGNYRLPQYLNNNGIDIAMFNLDNGNDNDPNTPAVNSVIANGQTSTVIRVGTTSDVYTLSVLVFGVDAYKPETDEIITLTAINGVAPVLPYTCTPGQELSYKVEIKNKGSEPIKLYKLSVPIPSNADFVPGSVTKTLHPLVTSTNTPLPVYNSVTRSLDWDFGNLPLHPTDLNTILASYTFKLKATTNCFLLSGSGCNQNIPVTGVANGTGVITNTNIVNQSYILGYNASGPCSEEVINGIINVAINGNAYVGANCDLETQDGILNLDIPASGSGYAISNISVLYPPGTKFYSAYPVVAGTIEYTAGNPFPAVDGTVKTYYAVPPGNNSCGLKIILTCSNNCAFTVTCGNQPPSTNYSCSLPIPAAVTTIAAFKTTFGATIGSNPCFTVKMQVIEDASFNPCTSNGYTRTYKIYQDTNGDNMPSAGELFVDCTKTYIWNKDNTKPVYSCDPAVPIFVGCKSGTPTAADAITAAGFSDNCGAPTVTAVAGATSSGTGCNKFQIWTVSAVDACGNNASVVITLKYYNDSVKPVFTNGCANSLIILPCNSTPTDAMAYAAVGAATDDCGTPTMSITSTTPGNTCTKTKVYTVRATDACGNFATCDVTYRWKSDVTNPVFSSCPNGIQILPGTTPPTMADAIAKAGNVTDNCGAVVMTASFAPATGTSCNMQQIWTVTATDSCGNFANCAVTIGWGSDPLAPIFAGGSSKNKNLGCNPPAITAAIAIAEAGSVTDNSGASPILSASGGTVGGSACARTQKWTVTATDGCGNSASFVINYSWKEDLIAPTFANVTDTTKTHLGCLGVGGATAAQAKAAAGAVSDNCSSSGNITVTAVGGIITGDCNKLQTWTVTATDECGNVKIKLVDLKWSFDDQNPVFEHCPVGIIDLGCNPVNLPTGAGLQDSVSILPDNCGQVSIVVTAGPITGTCSKMQTFTVTAKDNCNNIATCSITYKWKSDLQPPMFASCPSNPIVLAPGQQTTPAMAQAAVGAITDNCTSTNNLVITVTLEVLTGDCGEVKKYTVKAVDECGNMNSCVVTYTQTGSTEPPVFTNPPAGPINLGCNPSTLPNAAMAILNAGPVTDDIRVQDVVATAGQITGTCVKTQNFTVTASDDCGNMTPITVTFTWKSDTQKPVFANCPPAAILVTNMNLINDAYAIAQAGTPTDNCNIASITASHTSSDGPCGPTLIYQILATDDCGNTATCNVVFKTNNGSNPPTFSNCPSAPIYLGCNPQNLPTEGAVAEGAGNPEDDGEVIFVGVEAGPITGDCNKTQVFTVTAIDDCGNSGYCIITYKWKVDTDKPTFPEIPLTPVNLGCNPATLPTPASAIAAAGNIADNCDIDNVTAVGGNITGTCLQTQTFVITAIDKCGNSAQASLTFVWKNDTRAPTFANCTGIPINLGCNPAVLPTKEMALIQAGATGDDCAIDTVISVAGQITGTCTKSQIFLVTAYDECGNTTECSVTYTWKADTQSPVFVACSSAPINLGCNPTLLPNSENAILAAGATTDNCGGNISVTATPGTISGDCVKSQTFTVTAMDECGNFSNCFVVYNWSTDNTPPVITCPSAISNLKCASELPAAYVNLAAFTAAGGSVSDGCSANPTFSLFSEVITPGSCVNKFTVTRVYKVVDACGNSATCTQIITVNDNVPPVITCPAPINVACAGDVPAANPQGIVATDNCTGTVLVTFVNDVISNQSCANKYTITRTYLATDACGNSTTCTQTITVNDNVPPAISCPPSISGLECAVAAPAPYANAAQFVAAGGTISDNCVGTIIVSMTNEVSAPGICANSFILSRTYTATDVCGNFASCVQTITVADMTPPTITCPANLNLTCSTEVPAANIASVITSDNCAGIITVTVAEDVVSNQTCLNKFTINRTYTATDACGNASSCTQVIVVNDNIPPVMTCPNDLLLECATEVPAPNVQLVQASDNCVGTVVVTHVGDVIVDQACANQFTIERTYKATDVCGNFTTCTQYINVADITPPTITCPPNITVTCGSDVPVPSISSVLTTDNCVGVITVAFISDEIVDQICENRYKVIRTYSATDVCGNTSTCSQTITVYDDVAPLISILDPIFADVENGGTITLQCRALIEGWELPSLTSNEISSQDNCGGSIISMNQTVTNGSCEEDGYFKSIFVEILATDFCDNQSSFSFTIHIVDEIPPVFTVLPPDVTVSCANSNLTYDVQATDECECANISFVDNIINGACAGSYTIQRVYTAKDCCGNMSFHTQTINVVDDTPPVLIPTFSVLANIAQGDTLTSYCGQQELPEWLSLPADQLIGMSDGCSAATSMGFDIKESNENACWLYGYSKLYTITYSAMDACQNQAQFIFYIKVVDTIAPKLISIKEFICDDDKSWPVAIDGCSQLTYDYTDAPVANECNNGTNYIRTWTINDACQNTTYATQYVLTNDYVAPKLDFINPDYANVSNGDTISVECSKWNDVSKATALTWIESKDDCDFLTVDFKSSRKQGNCASDGYKSLIAYDWTAIDFCGNESEFKVYFKLSDNTPPVFNTNAPMISVDCENNIPQVKATDDCSNVTLKVVRNKFELGCPNNFTLEETYTATDACNNVSTFSRIVNVVDTTGPIIYVPDAVCVSDLGSLTPIAMDYCTNKPVQLSIKIDNTTINCNNSQYYTITYSASDYCGNTTTKVQKVILNDNTPPVLYFSSDFMNKYQIINNTIYTGCTDFDAFIAEIDASGAIVVSDECLETITPYYENEAGETKCEGALITKDHNFTWTATDACGNTDQLHLKVILQESNEVDFSFIGKDTSVYCNETVPLPSILPTLNCTQVSLGSIVNIGQATPDGSYLETRVFTYTNLCGEEVSYTQEISHLTTSDLACNIIIPEEVGCNSSNNIFTVNVTGGDGPYYYNWEILNGFCHIVAGQNTPTVQISISFKTLFLKVTVTDSRGCQTQCVIEVDCTLDGSTIVVVDPELVDISKPVVPENLIEDYTLRPNPTSSQVYLEFDADAAEEITVNISNQFGKPVYHKKMNCSKGFNSQLLETSSLPSGLYQVSLISSDKLKTLQLIKVK